MKVKELIEIAKCCGTGDCYPDCPYKQDEWDLDSVMYCMENLITDLANELEKKTLIIPVKKEVTHNDR